MKVMVSWSIEGKLHSATLQIPEYKGRWFMVQTARAVLPKSSKDCDLFFHTEEPFIDRTNHTVEVYQMGQGGTLVHLGHTDIPIDTEDIEYYISQKFKSREQKGTVFCLEYGKNYCKQPFPAETVSVITREIPGEAPTQFLVETSGTPTAVAVNASGLCKGECHLTKEKQSGTKKVYRLRDAEGVTVCKYTAEEMPVEKGGGFRQSLCWDCKNACPDKEGTCGCNWSRKFESVEGWDTISRDGDISHTVLRCPEFKPDERTAL